MSVDTKYYAPDFLIKVNGNTFRLGANIDILSVRVTESTQGSDTFELSVRDRHPTLERFPNGEELKWMDSDQFEELSDVEIEMGYVQNRTLKSVGKITAVTVDFPASGVPTLSIQGQSLYTQLQRERTSKPFAAKRDGDIVRQIASKFNLTPEVDDTNTEHETVSYREGTSYADILQDRAGRLNYEVGVKQRKLYFQKPRYLVSTSTDLTLAWGERLLSFRPRLTSNVPTGYAQRSATTAIGGDKNQPIVSEVQAADLPPRLGSRSGPAIVKEKFGDNIYSVREHRAESPEEGKTVAEAQMQRAALGFVQGDGETIGEPRLVSRKVIELKGLGKKFSGKYYVTKTVHTIDANGYRTSFTAKRDAI
jgi:phage protein D